MLLSKKVIVIGAGVGGLATAIRLARRGFEVEVYEAQAQAGGKAHRIRYNDFSWGFGPSLFTMPHLLDDLFELCGKRPSDYYSYIKLDPICRYFFSDGTRLDAHADNEKMANELEQKLGEPKENTLQYFRHVNHVFDVTKDIFLQKPISKLSTYLNWGIFRSIANLPFIGIFDTMFKANAKRFKDQRTVQLFNRYATYNGSNPYIAPATLNVIAAPEYGQGGFILKGGMPVLSESMYKLATELGVVFHFNQKVERILVNNGKATGVVVNGKELGADIVVSNMDVMYSYKELLKEAVRPAKILDQERSTSAAIFYWAMDRSFPELDCHNIFFSKDYKTEFETMERGKKISDDPTIYVFISKKYNPEHAPEGCENWFVLINVPYNDGQDWDAMLENTKSNIVKRISKELGVNVAEHIVHEERNDPRTIESKTWSFKGALYGNSSNNKYAAFLRHANYSNHIKDLYFCGGSVHPGGGVPLCLLSGKIIDELIP